MSSPMEVMDVLRAVHCLDHIGSGEEFAYLGLLDSVPAIDALIQPWQ